MARFHQHDSHPFLAAVRGRKGLDRPTLDALARRVRAGRDADGNLTPDAIDARNAIVEANLGLVVLFASDFRPPTLDFDQALEAGAFGLIRAAEKFDPGRGNEFSTYAMLWCRSFANKMRAERDQVHVPDYLYKPVAACLGRLREHPEDADRLATLDGIAGFLGVSRSDAELIRDGLTVFRRLGGSFSIHDAEEESRDVPDPHGGADPWPDSADSVAALMAAVDGLDPRTRDVIRFRYGLGGEHPHTFIEIGQRLGLTRERARQIELHGVALVRAALTGAPPPGHRAAIRAATGKRPNAGDGRVYSVRRAAMATG